jgi:hypothetical protein
MGYDPLRVNLLPRGTIKRFLQSKEGVPRIARIGMRENQFKEFIAHATRE